MLGHDLTFNYCRRTGTGMFCRKIYDCWSRKIDLASYLAAFFTADEIKLGLGPPSPKLNTLLNLIDKSPS
jgi:hypothetical protein